MITKHYWSQMLSVASFRRSTPWPIRPLRADHPVSADSSWAMTWRPTDRPTKWRNSAIDTPAIHKAIVVCRSEPNKSLPRICLLSSSNDKRQWSCIGCHSDTLLVSIADPDWHSKAKAWVVRLSRNTRLQRCQPSGTAPNVRGVSPNNRRTRRSPVPVSWNPMIWVFGAIDLFERICFVTAFSN